MAMELHPASLSSTLASMVPVTGGGSKGIGTKLLPCTSKVLHWYFDTLIGTSEPFGRMY